MEIEFDAAKDKSNREKHGVSLGDAAQLDWENAYTRIDSRKEYGETRKVSLVPMGERIYSVVHVNRGNSERIISLRKANNREIRIYENQA